MALYEDPRTEDTPLPVGSGAYALDLHLRRFKADARRRASSDDERPVVLLLHGGNTNSDTFLEPEGGLARYLAESGWDVRMLDWRGSPYVADKLLEGRPLGGSVAAERARYTIDAVAELDIPSAVAKIRLEIGARRKLSIVGHCLGGGALSMAIARGKLAPELGVTHVVLLTMGLFYEVPWDGWVKAEDFLLERALAEAPGCRGINPKVDLATWPEAVRTAYEHWPKALLPGGSSEGEEMLRKLTFMLGRPYRTEDLHPRLREADALLAFFGTLHMGLYLHAGQMVRRGYSARFGQPDVIDRPRVVRGQAPTIESDLLPDPFSERRVTLITGSENHLWHRDSIDCMYEWLRNEAPTCECDKAVLTGYGHQELLWGKHSASDVYPLVREGLG